MTNYDGITTFQCNLSKLIADVVKLNINTSREKFKIKIEIEFEH